MADIGHVHLKVAQLDRSVAFYRDVLGMEVKNQIDGAAFLAFGSYHHHVALNTWHSKDGEAPAAEMTGLQHFAIRYSTRRELAQALRRVLDAGIPLESSSDCGGVADSIYLQDPDGNGLELTWDRPRELRPDPLRTEDQALDLDELLAEA